jgi:hypothetical protein
MMFDMIVDSILSPKHDFYSECYVTSKHERATIVSKLVTIRKEAVIAIFKALSWRTHVH